MDKEQILDAIGRNRHPNVASIMVFFAFAHLPEHLQATSEYTCSLAIEMCKRLPDSSELVAGLRKLLEGKDCFVRAAL